MSSAKKWVRKSQALVDFRSILKTREAHAINPVVLLPAGTRNPKIQFLPEHTTAFLSNMIQKFWSKLLWLYSFPVQLTKFMVKRIKFRSLFFSPWGFMESVYSSNRLTSLHFLKKPILAYSVRVFQSLKNSVLLLFFRVFRLSRCRIPFLRVWFSITAVYRSTVDIGSGRMIRILRRLR